MNFGIDGGGIGPGTILLIVMVLTLVIGVIRYTLVSGPQEDREYQDNQDAAAIEHAAEHENDVPVADPGKPDLV